MKYLTIIATILSTTAVTAATPNNVTMTFKEFVEASGCVIVDKGGYNNLEAVSGGNCPAKVIKAWAAVGSKRLPGPDGVLDTADDYTVSDH